MRIFYIFTCLGVFGVIFLVFYGICGTLQKPTQNALETRLAQAWAEKPLRFSWESCSGRPRAVPQAAEAQKKN